MPKTAPYHLIWFGIAIAAFLAGIWLAPSGEKELEIGTAETKSRSAQGERQGSRHLRSGLSTEDAPRAKTPDELAQSAFNTSDPVKSAVAFGRLLESLRPEDAMEIEMNFRGTIRQRALFRYAWGSIDGRGAVEYALEHLSGEILGRFLLDMLPGWGSGDPATAIAWFDGPGSEEVRQALRRSGADIARFRDVLESTRSQFTRGIADQDIELATEYAYQTMHEGDLGDTLKQIAPRVVRQRGGAAAGVWAESLPEGPHKGIAMEHVARAFVQSDPRGAERWTEEYEDQPWAAGALEIIRREFTSRRMPLE